METTEGRNEAESDSRQDNVVEDEGFDESDEETGKPGSQRNKLPLNCISPTKDREDEKEAEEGSSKLENCYSLRILCVRYGFPKQKGEIFKVIKEVGKLKAGSSGCVVNIYEWKYGKKIAGKHMDTDLYPQFKREIEIVQNLSDNNVAQYIVDYKDENDKVAILFTELCDFSLNEYIMKEAQLEDNCEPLLTKNILMEAIAGIKYLHGHGVLHMDLKPNNIMFLKYEESATKSKYVLKLIDFGLSRKLDPNQSSITTQTVHGTKCYMGPECYDKQPTLKKSRDVFALGLVFYYVLTGGKHPFGTTENKIASNIEDRNEPNFGDLTKTLFEWCFQHLCNCKNNKCQPHCADLRSQLAEEQCVLAKDLISRMIRKDPKMRPTIEEVEIHPFFWDSATKEQFFLAAYHVAGNKDKTFIKSLNTKFGKMDIEDLCFTSVPVPVPKKPYKNKIGEFKPAKYENLHEYLKFLRNMLSHDKDDPSKTSEFNEENKEVEQYLTNTINRRLPLLTFPYPRLLIDLLEVFVGDEMFTKRFCDKTQSRRPGLDLTLMKTMKLLGNKAEEASSITV